MRPSARCTQQASEGGLFYGGFKLLGAAAVFLVAHLAWVGTASLLIFTALSKLGLLRVPLHVDLATLSEIDMDASKARPRTSHPARPPLAPKDHMCCKEPSM